jgi:hypothetical protein
VNASDIETARNIVGLDDDHFDPVEEVKDESSRLPDRGGVKDFSDQDSVIDVVNQMEEDDGGLGSGDFSNSPTVHQLRSKLERAETENDELKEKLYRV